MAGMECADAAVEAVVEATIMDGNATEFSKTPGSDVVGRVNYKRHACRGTQLELTAMRLRYSLC